MAAVAQTTTSLISNNNMSTTNVTSTPVDNSSSPDSFCITCGFDFGTIISGVDNKVAGVLFVLLSFTLICSPCIIMACCYMFRKCRSPHHKKSKKSRGKKYRSTENNDDNDADDDEDLSDS